jgi:NADPH-dependent 2,4-dienoyl-CoA reductase/sulfur reductase-like enzyme
LDALNSLVFGTSTTVPSRARHRHAPQSPTAAFGRAQRERPSKTIVEPEREVPVLTETDILVVGGGPAGTAAAIAAARLGADVLLVER